MPASAESQSTVGSCRYWGTALLVLLTSVGLLGCTQERSGEIGDRKPSRPASIQVAREFLQEAAAGDSAQLVRIARDTVVKTILLNHRLGSVEHLLAGASTFRSPSVSIYPSGSDMRFRYRLQGKEYDAFVALELEGGRLVVSNYGIPAIID